MSWIRYCKANRSSTKGAVEETPLLNDLVLDTLFGLLRGEDLKICRLVCKKWNMNSESHFRKRSRIVFPPRKYGKISSNNNMEEFLKVFPVVSDKRENYFTAITFKARIEENILINFFNSPKGQAIRDLEFQKVIIHCEDSDRSEYELKPLISNNKLTRLCIRNNIREENDCSVNDFLLYGCTTTIFIELSCLKFCDFIHLKNCVVVLDDVISPKSLTIKYSKFQNSQHKSFSGGNLNAIINFENCDKISLDKIWWNDIPIELDISSRKYKLLKVSLEDSIKVHDWKDTSWEIENLDLKLFDNFTGKTNIRNLHSLTLDRCCNGIDLGLLPDTIEKLNIRKCGNLGSSFDCILPNLKCLHIRPLKNSDLKFFRHCSNLVDLEFENLVPRLECRGIDLFNEDLIPLNVCRLRLINVYIDSFSDEREIDTLILKYQKKGDYKPILKILHPKTLVCETRSTPWWEGGQDDIKYMLEYTKTQTTVQTFIVGPAFNCNLPKTQTKRLTQMFKKEKSNPVPIIEFYRTQNGYTENIDKREFNEYFRF